MTERKIILSFLFILVASGVLVFTTRTLEQGGEIGAVSTYAECVAAGNPVLESYPPKCKTPDGRTFTEDVGNRVEKQGLIQVHEPFPNQVIKSPVTINGKARGFWYFEASFPVSLYDANGIPLVETFIQADGEWMTEDFVPFHKILEFKTPSTPTGLLILRKDNPSGLPQHDDELKIPVVFKKEGAIAQCVPGGCSGQLCIEEGIAEGISTCEFRAEYACYASARCERQTNGSCGWTNTKELRACLQNPPSLQ